RAEALRARGITPKLAIVRCGENPSDLAYERGAAKRAEVCGLEIENVLYPEDVTKEELISGIEKLNGDDSVHGVLLFRPLPGELRKCESEIANHLLPEKDVDCMTDLSHAGVYTGKDLGYPPCTPEACMKILDYYEIDLKGKNVTVIGRSLVVGKPVTMMLMGRHATVTVCHTRTADVAGIASAADIVVTSAGVLKSLTKDYVRPGQVVIDVSINWDPEKKNGQGGIAGDADFEEVEPIVSAITPVPGGVGAVTTSVLMEHVVRAAEVSSLS
ncbi:MAG: bifunctional 5,10-methylenetetrahydrofolate dehydrogenase/5,10-methenyltetrahydrofolate cyclohydrolase, partial [Lachnospiraceae bacterium]|nr:bifunctional 5,10-methylenetetrahydrofolate dehydrogenase/5,10-methenyltetrahydrofolate cyclohydrolase [Lachnospiraceae bacterium]